MIQKTNIHQLWLPEATTVILEPTGAIGCRWKAKKNRENARIWYDSSSVSKPQTGRLLFFDAWTKPGTCELPLFWYINPPKGLAQTSIKTRGTSGVRSWGPVPTVPFHPGTPPVAMILPWNRTRVPSREGENISHPRGVSANHRLKKRQTVISKEEDMLYVSFQDNKHSQQQKYKKLLQL